MLASCSRMEAFVTSGRTSHAARPTARRAVPRSAFICCERQMRQCAEESLQRISHPDESAYAVCVFGERVHEPVDVRLVAAVRDVVPAVLDEDDVASVLGGPREVDVFAVEIRHQLHVQHVRVRVEAGVELRVVRRPVYRDVSLRKNQKEQHASALTENVCVQPPAL